MKESIFKKPIALLIILSLLLSNLACLIPVAASEGTPIGTAEELLTLMNTSSMWGGDYYLTADIDLSTYSGSLSPVPIGSAQTTAFTGTFDGRGHTVSGLDYSKYTKRTARIGFFGATNGAEIRNLTVEGTVSAAGQDVGGIVGVTYGKTVIENCVNNCTVSGKNNVGGIAGRTHNGADGTVIKNCTNNGDVTGITKNTGGIIGGVNGTEGPLTVNRCINTGDITGATAVGGIVGLFNATPSSGSTARDFNLTECANSGTVTTTSASGVMAYAGGIVGNSVLSNIRDCLNTGIVVSKDGATAVGGVLGGNEKSGGTLGYCIDRGEVNTNGVTDAYVGQIVGYALEFPTSPCYFVSVSNDASGGTPWNNTELYASEKFDTLNTNGKWEVVDAEPMLFFMVEFSIPGDMNKDGKFGVMDSLMILKKICNNEAVKADINADGKTDFRDVIRSFKFALNGVKIVACVGDSITEGIHASNPDVTGYPALLQHMLGSDYLVINCGKSGAYALSPDSPYNARAKYENYPYYPNTREYEVLKASQADIIIVMLGTNDCRSLTEAAAVEEFKESYKSLIADFQSMESNPQIYISSIIPATNAYVMSQNSTILVPNVLEEIANELELPFIPTHENVGDYYTVMLPYNDHVHPVDESYPALAVNFYNEVFGGDEPFVELPKAKNDVVYVSSKGSRYNDGSSPAKAVNKLSLAVSMLRENGGTVVVCGPLKITRSDLIPCDGKVTVTSLYDGIDYRDMNSAQLTVSRDIILASPVVFENLNIEVVETSDIYCNYNDFTVGEGVVCTGSAYVGINGGYCVSVTALDPEYFSCHRDCTISVASGTWAYVRGGNWRSATNATIGTVDDGVTVTVNISGGTFVGKSNTAISAIGMNGCEGQAVLNISGGDFAGNVCGAHRTGTTKEGLTANCGGDIIVNITGGTFAKAVTLYQDETSPQVLGKSTLTVNKDLLSSVVTEGFSEVVIMD